jgi:tetratricopeptide (TPR) repeat protein
VKKAWVSRLLAVSCVAMLTACANGPKLSGVDSAPSVELSVLMETAAASEKANHKDVALREYEEAAKLYPASALPWLRIAQIKFEATSYGEAITAAQQSVSRDERNNVAQSILAVSGLRVSTKALADLRRQNELAGTVRDEAQDLAKVLRESLGEQVLVPATPTAATTVATRPAPAPVVRRRTTVRKPVVEPLPAAETGKGNPFGALK